MPNCSVATATNCSKASQSLWMQIPTFPTWPFPISERFLLATLLSWHSFSSFMLCTSSPHFSKRNESPAFDLPIGLPTGHSFEEISLRETAGVFKDDSWKIKTEKRLVLKAFFSSLKPSLLTSKCKINNANQLEEKVRGTSRRKLAFWSVDSWMSRFNITRPRQFLKDTKPKKWSPHPLTTNLDINKNQYIRWISFISLSLLIPLYLYPIPLYQWFSPLCRFVFENKARVSNWTLSLQLLTRSVWVGLFPKPLGLDRLISFYEQIRQFQTIPPAKQNNLSENQLDWAILKLLLSEIHPSLYLAGLEKFSLPLFAYRSSSSLAKRGPAFGALW